MDDLRRRLESFPWFTRIETPHSSDSNLERVTLKFLLDQPLDPWNGAVAAAESRIDRLVIDSSRLSEQYLVQQAFRAPWTTGQADAVINKLYLRYPGCYKGTDFYPYELIEFPERMIRCALFECLLDDLPPRLTFFRDQLAWFEQGYWPCGWSGRHPEGRLILL